MLYFSGCGSGSSSVDKQYGYGVITFTMESLHDFVTFLFLLIIFTSNTSYFISNRVVWLVTKAPVKTLLCQAQILPVCLIAHRITQTEFIVL